MPSFTSLQREGAGQEFRKERGNKVESWELLGARSEGGSAGRRCRDCCSGSRAKSRTERAVPIPPRTARLNQLSWERSHLESAGNPAGRWMGDELKSTDLPPHPRRVRALLWLRSIDPTAEPGMRRDDPAGSGVGGGCGGCGAAVQPCRAQAPAPGPSAGIRLTWN